MGYKIKEARRRKGISQQKLAELSGISLSLIVALENGEAVTVTNKSLLKIANALGLTVGDIFFGASV